MKVAIIFEGSLTNRKGLVNAVLNRIKHLKDIAEYQIDVYSFQLYEGWLTRRLKHSTSAGERPDYITIDNIKIRILWYKYSLVDYVLRQKLNFRDIITERRWGRYSDLFKDYDIITVHSYRCGKFALHIKDLYDIPYYITWHGSDIHTLPHDNRHIKSRTIRIIEHAACNFFVSKALLKASETLSKIGNKEVLYNGASNIFYQQSPSTRTSLRQQNGVSVSDKVVAYVGNLFDIKNVLLLPQIFEQIKTSYKAGLQFWIIGDGEKRKELENLLMRHNIQCRLWGNVNSNKMPDIMNCIDVLILPSKNEGLPLVTVEALKCGANVVGSNVGGIAEVIGEENVFNLNEMFTENIARRVVEMLSTPIEQPVRDIFSWTKTANKENKIYKEFKLE